MVIAAAIQAALYIFLMCVVYIYNFLKYEATILASFQRYLNMAMMPLWIMIIYGFLNTGMVVRERTSMLIIASVVFFFTPTKAIYSMVTRASIESGVAFRARYEEMWKKIEATCDGNDNIYFISQGDNGFDYWVNRFNARPNNIPVYDRTGWSWSLGEPFYDGDIWTKDIPPENFQEVLISNCDYLAVFRTNDYFNEHYGSLFAGEIKNQSIYRVNKETGLMETCE